MLRQRVAAQPQQLRSPRLGRPHVRCLAAAPAAFAATSAIGPHGEGLQLVDTPVSNHGARVRFVLRKKGLTGVKTVSPADCGGLKSEQFLKLSPQGKFPTLIFPDGSGLPESEVIVQFLLDHFRGVGPALVAATPAQRAVGTLCTRIHDLYMSPVQGCTYRIMDSAELRAQQIKQLLRQVDILESTIIGPFAAGEHITTADGALAPSFAFLDHALPRHFGLPSVFEGRPKLAAWWDAVHKDEVLGEVLQEVKGGLQDWDKAGRWNKVLETWEPALLERC